MKILHYVPYSKLFPPSNGGTLRCFNIAKELSKKYEVDIVLVQNKQEIKNEYLKGFGKVNIFSPQNGGEAGNTSRAAKTVNSLKYRYLTRQYFRPADSAFLSLLPVFKELLKKNKYDIVVFEHLQAMVTAPFFRRYLPNCYFILDAHNVDHLLIGEEHHAHPINGFENKYAQILRYESSLANYVDGYWVCSQKDGDIFNGLNRIKLPLAIIPNGVDTCEKSFISNLNNDGKISLLFCGDLGTIANRSGIVWFIENTWALLQKKYEAVTLTIIGSGSEDPEFDKYKATRGIIFKGRVDNLSFEYLHSTISIAPLKVGSGTRLKILESLSYGVPVVATRKAAEGVAYEDGIQIMLADDPAEFCNKIFSLVENKSLYQKMRIEGRRFVELNYDWNVIGEKMAEFVSMHKNNV
jgi:glycosyltransferase involved in cell wall biosynthesis